MIKIRYTWKIRKLRKNVKISKKQLVPKNDKKMLIQKFVNVKNDGHQN
jgi:hypothetical protein